MKYRKLYNLHIQKLKSKLETCDEDIKKEYKTSVALKAKTDENYELVMSGLEEDGTIRHTIRKEKARIENKIKDIEYDLNEVETKLMLF